MIINPLILYEDRTLHIDVLYFAQIIKGYTFANTMGVMAAI